MSTVSSNERSLIHTRKLGWPAAIVESPWNPHSRVRQDLFGFLDLLALTGNGLMGIQACRGNDAAKHRRKIEAEPNVRHWLTENLLLELWAWSKRKVKRGGKQMTWSLRREAAFLQCGEIKWEVVGEP